MKISFKIKFFLCTSLVSTICCYQDMYCSYKEDMPKPAKPGRKYGTAREANLAQYINNVNTRREHMSKLHLQEAQNHIINNFSTIHDPALMKRAEKVLRHIKEQLAQKDAEVKKIQTEIDTQSALEGM